MAIDTLIRMIDRAALEGPIIGQFDLSLSGNEVKSVILGEVLKVLHIERGQREPIYQTTCRDPCVVSRPRATTPNREC